MNKSIQIALVFSVFTCFIYAELPPRLSEPSAKESCSIAIESIPSSLKSLFSKSSYLERCRFVKDLRSDLSGDEINALFLFITASPAQVGLKRSHFNSVGDKVINKLESQNLVPPELVDHLIAMFYDETGDFTWRDYCVQHLGALYATDAALGKREQIFELFSAAMEADAGMAGTVTLAFRANLGQEGISKELVSSKAAEVALNEEQNEASRLTSMLAAAELGNREMLILARGILESKESAHFRMSSMAAIGMLGDASDLPTLGKYTQSSDMRLRTASKAAAKKIEARQKVQLDLATKGHKENSKSMN